MSLSYIYQFKRSIKLKYSKPYKHWVYAPKLKKIEKKVNKSFFLSFFYLYLYLN